MFTITEQSPAESRRRRHHASIAVGRERGYYRVLFDSGPVTVAEFARLAGMPEERAGAWIAEQLDAEVLRTVPSPMTAAMTANASCCCRASTCRSCSATRGRRSSRARVPCSSERRDDVAPVVAAMLRT